MFRTGICRAIAAVTLAWAVAGCHGNAEEVAPGRRNSAGPEVEVVEQRLPDGTLRVRKHVIRRADGSTVNHGLYTRWFSDGAKEYEVEFVHGKKHGAAILWHRNGRQWTQEHYVNGVREGPRYTWDDKGRKRKEENYAADKPHGTWTVWRADGTIKTQRYFDHGRPVPESPPMNPKKPVE